MDQEQLDWDRAEHGLMSDQADRPGEELEVDTDDDRGV